METRRMYRSQTDKMLGGVCGGLGEYLNIDPTILRLVFALMALFGGHGILVYLVLWLIIPAGPLPAPVNRSVATVPPEDETPVL